VQGAVDRIAKQKDVAPLFQVAIAAAIRDNLCALNPVKTRNL
jgi:hypothetical protein